MISIEDAISNLFKSWQFECLASKHTKEDFCWMTMRFESTPTLGRRSQRGRMIVSLSVLLSVLIQITLTNGFSTTTHYFASQLQVGQNHVSLSSTTTRPDARPFALKTSPLFQSARRSKATDSDRNEARSFRSSATTVVGNAAASLRDRAMRTASSSTSEAHQWLGTQFGSARSLSDIVTSLIYSASQVFASLMSKAGRIVQDTWWCLPMALSFVPLYSYVFLQSHASMPCWWSVVKMDYLWNSPYARHIVAVFLGSNLSYFLSGSYLLAKYRPKIHGPDGCPLLGSFVLAAGFISTLFHSVQALGPYELAEGLCFVDHGVAGSAISYFWYKCGRPSKTTFALSMAGLATLVLSGPGYAWLHSTWHLLSAAAAVVWARDGLGSGLTLHEQKAA